MTMSVPLREEKRSEAPLITFTLCVPAAVGVVALAALFGLALAIGGDASALLQPGSLLMLTGGSALLFTVVGMLASMLHLAKPLRAPFSLRHLSSSWLSREIAAVALFFACIVVWVGGALLGSMLCAAAGLACAAVFGTGLLFVIARAYKVPTRPAWSGSECSMELIAAACGSGSAVFLLCLSICTGMAIEGAPRWASITGSLGVAPCIASIALSCALMVVGVVLGARAHTSRYNRLCSLREASDERIVLTLGNYESLVPVVRRAWRIEVAAVVIGTIGGCLYGAALVSGASASASITVPITLFSFAVALELIAHGMQRWLFYEIPVPVRYVALLRK